MTEFRQSASQSQRRVKACKNDLRSHLLSIIVDSEVVDEVFNFLEPLGMPCIANLRNGLWYSKRGFHGECYFKSTDGHHGQWHFSAARLNLTLAKHAIDKGGALIIDSTKQGKRFPDSFTATIPIWCAIINFIVLHRGERTHEGAEKRIEEFLHPEWIDKITRKRIVTKCASMALDLPSSAVELIATTISQACQAQAFKEFRPIWACPDEDGSIEWIGNDAEALLEACTEHKSEFLESCHTCHFSHGGRQMSRPVAYMTTGHNLDFTPLVLLSVSGARNSVNYASASGMGIAVVEDFLGNVTLDTEVDRAVESGDYTHSSVHSWEYVPGAGDDEESWAKGLTAGLFWEHTDFLLGGEEGEEVDAGCDANALLEYRVKKLLSTGSNEYQNKVERHTSIEVKRVGDSHVCVCRRPVDMAVIRGASGSGDRVIVVSGEEKQNEKEDGESPTHLFLALSCDKRSKSLNKWGLALTRAALVDSFRDAGGRTIVCAESETNFDSAVAVAVALYGTSRKDESTTAKLQARAHLAVVHAALGWEIYPPRWVMREVGVFLDCGRKGNEGGAEGRMIDDKDAP